MGVSRPITMNRYSIFISSTIEDLSEARAGVDEELRRVEIFEPIRVENLPASEEASRRVCLREVNQADAIVLILKDRYGFVPEKNNPGRLSVTHLEYREAKRLKKPVFAFLLDGALPEPDLASLIQEVSDFDEGVLRKKWSTTTQLREAVRRALLFWIARRARQTGSTEIQQQAATELGGDPKFGRFPVVIERELLPGPTNESWHNTLLDELARECRRRLLPTPYLEGQRPEGSENSALIVKIWPNSDDTRIDLNIRLTGHDESPTLPLPAELDSALTEDGARFAAQCSLAFMLLAADDWSMAIDQLLAVSKDSSASKKARARLVATAAYVSASNQGQRSTEVVQHMLDLPKLDSQVVGAGVMALVSAELRLEHARAKDALRDVERHALRLLTTALIHEPTAADVLYNLARQCLRHPSIVAVSFYDQLLRADPTYDERWYFHRDLGLIYYGQGNLSNAAQYYDRACHLRDNDSELFRFAGDAYYYRGHWADALLRYERALAIEPIESYFLDTKISFCRARIRTGTDRDTSFRRRRDLSHRFSRAGSRAAEAGQRWLLAQPLFRVAKRLSELNFDADSWLALFANRRGAYAEAAALLKSALAAMPEDPSARLNLVMNLIFQNEGKFGDCARNHAKIAIFHGGPEAQNRFRLMLTNTDNKDRLCEQFSEIVEVVRSEREEWIRRRSEVLKPEQFGRVIHVEFRR